MTEEGKIKYIRRLVFLFKKANNLQSGEKNEKFSCSEHSEEIVYAIQPS